MTNKFLRAGLAACLVLCLAGPAAFAQGSWDLSPDLEPPLATPHDFGIEGTGNVFGPIDFEEAEFPLGTQVDGLVVNTLDGAPLLAPLSFGFTVGGVPSIDSTVNSGPPPQMFVIPPGIEGDVTGTLTIDFGIDVSSVEFGFAVACASPVFNPGATVTAYDAADGVVGMTSADAIDTGNVFFENQIVFAPGTFRYIEVTFGEPLCSRFFLDNLSYEEASVVAGALPIPTLNEVSMIALVLSLLAAGFLVLRGRMA